VELELISCHFVGTSMVLIVQPVYTRPQSGNYSRSQQRSESCTGISSCSIPEQSAPKPSPSQFYLYIKLFSSLQLPCTHTLLIHDLISLKSHIYIPESLIVLQLLGFCFHSEDNHPEEHDAEVPGMYVHVHRAGKVQVITNKCVFYTHFLE
jgi:hypothetical protein